ncbi:MAG: hypothetical protein OEW37_04655 [Rhodospirillaceae bacterium]|nr:hypothetical protein [Rhodospirillaceae bacterium]
MSDISRFSSQGPSRVNIAQAALDARKRKSEQNPDALSVSKDGGGSGGNNVRDAKKASLPEHKFYLDQEEVSFRARVMGQAESPENIRSLARLKRVFDAGQPLRGDVPRGYYLNLRV